MLSSMEIPGYNIIDTLGQGETATVYLALHENTEREVALKVLSHPLATDPHFNERFLGEARFASRLNHPNIVSILEVGVHEGNHFLAMDYVPGRELNHRRFELNLPQSLQVITDIALALDYAGREGFVHLDVKPENILIHQDDGRAVLMDFGMAHADGPETGLRPTGALADLPYFVSPERFETTSLNRQSRDQSPDQRADIYSLGVVAYLLLAGRLPYEAETVEALAKMHSSADIPRLPRHLSIFQPLIDRAMAKLPQKRYQSASELIADLKAIPSADIVLAIAACHRQLVVDDGSASPTMAIPQPFVGETRHPASVEADVGEGFEEPLTLCEEDRADRGRDIAEAPATNPLWGWLLGMGMLVLVVIGIYVF